MKILILKSYGLGNLIMMTPMVRALHDSGHSVSLLSDSGPLGFSETKELLDGWRCLKEIKEFDRRTNKDGNDLIKWLGDEKFNLIIQSFPADDYFNWLFPYIDCPFRRPLSVDSNWDKHEVEYNLDLVKDIVNEETVSVNYEIPGRVCSWISDLLANISSTKPLIGICPSYKKEGLWWKKHWGTENYAKLISLFPEGFRFVLLEGPGGIDTCNTIQFLNKSKDVINLAGATNIQETVAAIDMCDLIIANDSGPAHIAAALKKPLFVIFGPTSVTKNQPLSRNTVVLKIEKCPWVMPCQGTEYFKKCRNPVCMTALTPEVIMQVVQKHFIENKKEVFV